MYIWTAIDLGRQVDGIRKRAEAVCSEMGVDNPAFTLPSHISLKISCEIDDRFFDEAVERLCEKFDKSPTFEIKTDRLEKNGGILWIKHHPSDELCRLHSDLVDFFREYRCKEHIFDSDFAYHTSLYVGAPDVADRIYSEVCNTSIPKTLKVESYIIGCSETGVAGEYRVFKRINKTKIEE